MPYANHYEGHCNDSTLYTENINEDLEDWLAIFRTNGFGKVLDTEKVTKDKEESKERRHGNGGDDTDWSTSGCIPGLFGKMC